SQRARAALALELLAPLLALRHARAADRADAEKMHDLRDDLAVAVAGDENAHLAPVVPEGRQDQILPVPRRADEGLVARPEACGDVAAADLEAAGAAHELDEHGGDKGDRRLNRFTLQYAL